MMITFFIIYMLLMSKLGYGLTWVDWVVLFLVLLINFLKFSVEAALVTKGSKLLDGSKNKKDSFVSKIT